MLDVFGYARVVTSRFFVRREQAVVNVLLFTLLN
jgi:hypothetical protein